MSDYFEVEVKGTNFMVYREPTRAQKEVDDNNPPGPWPWWVASEKHSGGPYTSKDEALDAIGKMV